MDIGESATARAIRDLKDQNKNLKVLLFGNMAQAKEMQKRASNLNSAIADFNAAFMEWMPRLRHSNNETAQEVAAAMRKLKAEIEEKLNG